MALPAMDWRRYRALPPARRRLLREALASLFLARAALAFVPFRRLAAGLGEMDTDSVAEIPEAEGQVAADIAWAIQATASRVPWDSRCLAQAMAGYRMLWKRGIPSTVYFGVKKDPQAPFSAHAWLRCGAFIVTGEAGHADYRVLCRFSRPIP